MGFIGKAVAGPFGGLMGGGGGGQGYGGGGGMLAGLAGGNTPQAQGYGLDTTASNQPFQQHQTAPGLSAAGTDNVNRFGASVPGGGQLTRAPEGWDFTSPGVAEQYFNNQQGQFSPGASAANQYWQQTQGQLGEAGQGEQYWNQVAGKFNAPTASGGVFQNFDASRGAGLDPYYDRANTKLASRLNQQAAMTGSLGGTAANAMMAEGLSGLAADQANREAEHYLKQNQLAGSLASQFDQNNLAQMMGGGQLSQMAQSQNLARLGLGGQLSQGADAATLNRLNSGMNAAGAAQDARRMRGRDYMGDMSNMAGMGQNIMGGYDQMLMDDQQLMDAAIAMNLGLGSEWLSRTDRAAERQKADERHGMDMFQSIMSMAGGGMGGMGGG